MVSSGHIYAASRVCRHYSLSAHVGELSGGLEQLQTLRTLLLEAAADWPALLRRLEATRSALLCTDGMLVNLTGDAQSMAAADLALPAFISAMPSAPAIDAAALTTLFGDQSWSPRLGSAGVPTPEGLRVPTQVAPSSQRPRRTRTRLFSLLVALLHLASSHRIASHLTSSHLTSSHPSPPLLTSPHWTHHSKDLSHRNLTSPRLAGPLQVNYVAKGAPIYAPGESARGSSAVVSRWVGTSHLWDAVRVTGGAYGCSLGLDRFSGVATFTSYRDPSLQATLAAYDATATVVRGAAIDEAELSQAIIGTIGDLDAPQVCTCHGRARARVACPSAR